MKQSILNQNPIHAVLHAGAMYFFFYFGLGAFMPYINLYYERIGLSGVQIGTLSAIPVVVLSLTSVFWGTVADAFRLHRVILSLALLTTPVAVLLLSSTQSYTALAGYILLYAIFASPIVPLLDSSTMNVVRSSGYSFGVIRVAGSISWSISTWLIGSLIERYDLRLAFYAFALFLGITFLLSLIQPVSKPISTERPKYDFKPLLNLEIGVFLLSVFFVAVTIGAVNAFFSIYLDGIGAGEGIIGLAWALASISEIPILIYSGRLMRRMGAAGLLRMAFIVYTLRWLLLSFINQPELALLTQLMHGLSFGAFLVGGVVYISDRVPEDLGTTAQSLLNTMTFGLGPITGSLIGGYLYDYAGLPTLFRILSVSALIAFLLFTLANRRAAPQFETTTEPGS